MNIKLLLLLFISFSTQAQVEDAWIFLKDKPQATYYVNNPTEMLSQKALNRRLKQNISLSDSDAPIHTSYKQTIAAQSGIEVLASSKWMNALHVQGDVVALQSLMQLSFVKTIEFANRSRNVLQKQSAPKQYAALNKQVEQQASLPYGTSANQINMLNGNLLHEQGYTGNGITIAVLDTGFLGVDTTSPFQKIKNNNQILGGYDFVRKSTNVYTSDNHGTRVLSCMAGFEKDKLVGTAPDANYYLFITEDVDNETPLEESLWVEAAERADSLGVDIITTSLGYTTYTNKNYSYTYANMNGKTSFIARGLEQAFSKGIFCVAAAGNDGNKTWKYICTPADSPSALTVGAVDASENYAAFSSIGPSADGRIKPDVMAQGQLAVVAFDTGEIKPSSGTSFAAPITAGMVACAWQALPNVTNTQLLQLIKESATLYSMPNEKYGYGIPNFQQLLGNNLNTQTFTSSGTIIYPNPANDLVTLSNLPINASVYVYDIKGVLVYNQKIFENQHFINISNWNIGLYLIKIVSENEIIVNKLIKK